MEEILYEAQKCTQCEVCMEVCPTYEISRDALFSPMHRLGTAVKLFKGMEIDPHEVESIYNCPKCMYCEDVCPEDISVTRIVHKSREELARRGLGPLEKHNEVINGILRSGNAVNGDPSKRLDWLPETFPTHESSTLLYMGCLPSYLVKDAATSTYLVLKKLGLDFMIMEDEGCCGTYLYESGRTDLSLEFFQKNTEKFKSLGITRVIVPCNGCLKCFKYFYPDLLGETGFSVEHAVEVIYDLLRENHNFLHKVNRTLTYQDPCRLGRGEGITEEPRQILKWCGATLKETDKNREEGGCCGAGGGIRSVYRDLSMEIAANLLNRVATESVISTCPSCTFNLNYTSRKKELNKNTLYFTRIVFESLS